MAKTAAWTRIEATFLDPPRTSAGFVVLLTEGNTFVLFDESGFAGLLLSSDTQLFIASLIFSLQVCFRR